MESVTVGGLCCIWVSSEEGECGGESCSWWLGSKDGERKGGLPACPSGNVPINLHFPLGLPLVDVTSNSIKVGGQTSDFSESFMVFLVCS